jgi:nicotinic acid mononucleotide adenylyltransferase
MKFRQFILEAVETLKKATTGQAAPKKSTEKKEIAFTFGRFNPPHAGHGKLLDSCGKACKNYRVYASPSQDAKKNPLDHKTKVEHMKNLFPKHADKIDTTGEHRNVFDIMSSLHDEGHTHVKMVVGDDRVEEFQSLFDKYKDKYPNIKKIDVQSAGARDEESKDPIETLSASKQRLHAQKDDHQSFHAGMPKGTDPEHSKKLMQDVQAAMAKKEEKKKPAAKKKKVESIHEVWEIAPSLDYETLRHHYILENIYKIGAIVEHMDTGIRGEVLHRGTNYLIFVDDDNNSHRAWLTSLNEVNKKESADQSSTGNDWYVGGDKYREDVQKMTPGQPVVKFSEFRKNK